MNILFFISIFGLAAFGQSSAGNSDSKPDYAIAFASFAPMNTDIFVADADGGNPKTLLAHAASDYNASFSRDGKWIVFTSERNGSADIYRVRSDGSGLERLTDDPAYDDQAVLSPDGKMVAFVSSRSGQADIWVLEISTKKLRNLTNNTDGDFRPAWSPDGKWIAFSSDRDSKKVRPAGGFIILHSTDIYIMRSDGTGSRRITHAQAFAGSPSWSPDGKRLVIYEAELTEVRKIISVERKTGGDTQLATIDVGTGERRVLTSGKGEKLSPRWLEPDRIAYVRRLENEGIEFTDGSAGVRGDFANPNWSADGRRMVFHRNVDNTWPPFREWRSRDEQFSLVRTGIFPSYSPSGDRFISNDRTAGILHNSILLMNADGTKPSVLYGHTDKSALAPVWSPDGKRIAFALGKFFQAIQGPSFADIAVINSNGTGLKVLTKGNGNYGFPSWSPDGQRIVYRAANSDKKGLFIIDIETGEVKTLIDNAQDNFPSWSPTGDLIAFTSFRDGDYEIYTIKPDGTGLKRLTNIPGNDAHSAWSPDGKWIAFSSAKAGFKDEAGLHPLNPQPYGEIYVMRSDGSDLRMLTDNQYEEATPGWIPVRSKSK